MKLRYYLFDPALDGVVTVAFDDDLMHAKNLREHLDGFVALADEEFVVHGVVEPVIDGDVITYANGEPRRMKDGFSWIIRQEVRQEFREWLVGADWPTDDNGLRELRLPGRWLTPLEAARVFLEFQGMYLEDEDRIVSELVRRGVDLETFSR